MILKPAPQTVQRLYLQSLRALGINLRQHDLRFEEDNWEAPTLGAWGIGWQVVLDGLEITQFTYFQQCGGFDLDPPSAELTYGLERITAFLQGTGNVFELAWTDGVTYGDVRLDEERQFTAYSFEWADVETCRRLFELNEREAQRLLDSFPGEASAAIKARAPVLAAYDLCLKCSHLFNLLDSRGAISTTERASLIARVRAIACRAAALYLEQQRPAASTT